MSVCPSLGDFAIMQNTISTVVSVPAVGFSLSAERAEFVSVAAELAMDSTFDFSKACDSVASVLGGLKSEGLLTFAAWESVRGHFVSAAEVRARDNGAADAKGAAEKCWQRMAKRNEEIHGISKPRAENPEAQAKALKREAEKVKALDQAKGKSVADLESEKRALYSEASDESIAKAKALEKVIKVVASTEKETLSAQMKPLVEAAAVQHKAVMEYLKGRNDPALMGDYVVLLKRTLEVWKEMAK
jgi:hypothetical protein